MAAVDEQRAPAPKDPWGAMTAPGRLDAESRGRLYELALRALEEKERRVGEPRGRLAPVIAAGNIGLTLLTRPAFDGRHPRTALSRCRRLRVRPPAPARVIGAPSDRRGRSGLTAHLEWTWP